jgi:hypothetical protein
MGNERVIMGNRNEKWIRGTGNGNSGLTEKGINQEKYIA